MRPNAGHLTTCSAQMFADIVRFQKLAITGLEDLDAPFDPSPAVSGPGSRETRDGVRDDIMRAEGKAQSKLLPKRTSGLRHRVDPLADAVRPSQARWPDALPHNRAFLLIPIGAARYTKARAAS